MQILGKYAILGEMGRGKFGIVYRGNRLRDDEPVAIKIESHENIDTIKILKHETTMLNYLRNHGCIKVPAVYWYGIYLSHPTLVMTMYDMSLEDYLSSQTEDEIDLDERRRWMGLLIHILREVHKNHVIHRDVKPANFMLKGGELFLIDFGMATFYIDADFRHIEYKEGRDSIIGTPKYISHHVHQLIEPVRRDDLISLGYVFMKMAYGELPWETATIIEIQEMKSWENIKSCIGEENALLYNYMKACYCAQFQDTLDYLAWIHTFLDT